MCGQRLPRTMNWGGRLPMSLALGPFLLGFVTSILPYLIEYPFFVKGSLIGPVTISAIFAIQFAFYPEADTDKKTDLLGGIYVGMLVAFAPQIIFFVWFIPVFLFWLARTSAMAKSNFPPFRVGLWIGNGILSGVYFGSILSHFIF